MNDIKGLEQEVADSMKKVEEAVKEIEDAKEWHYKMLVWLAGDIQRLEEAKKQV